MGMKLDMDVNTVLTPWVITYVQISAYEGEVDDTIREMYVIAPDYESAKYWAEEINHHGDLFDILKVTPAIEAPMQICFEAYKPQNEEFYVVFGGDKEQGTPKQWQGPFQYEHQAEQYAKGVDATHKPRVVVHYVGEPTNPFFKGD